MSHDAGGVKFIGLHKMSEVIDRSDILVSKINLVSVYFIKTIKYCFYFCFCVANNFTFPKPISCSF